jgi:hypothetical protein
MAGFCHDPAHHSKKIDKKVIRNFTYRIHTGQLIETICNDVLPNMVRIYESKKTKSALDQDQFVTGYGVTHTSARRLCAECTARS